MNETLMEKIEKLSDIYDIENSIRHFIFEIVPRKYMVPDRIASIEEIKTYPAKTKVTTYGYIDKIEKQHVRSDKIGMIKATLYKDGHKISLQWTSSKAKLHAKLFSLEKQIEKGKLIQVSGTLDKFQANGGFEVPIIRNPNLAVIEKEISANTNGNMFVIPEPIYPLKNGIKNHEVHSVFKNIILDFDSIDRRGFMPIEIEQAFGMQPLRKSLEFMHGMRKIPLEKFESFLNYEGFKRRVMAEKVWEIVKRAEAEKTESAEPPARIDDEESVSKIKEIAAGLPFELTSDQKRAIWLMSKNMSSKGASKNLLFGDVGTGKTIVALLVSALFMNKGFQSAILAPTAILAKQHYEEAKSFFPDNVFLVTSSTKEREKKRIQKLLLEGYPMIVYGTTSVNRMKFSNLGLVVVDEEQKFGVNDKEKLYRKYYPKAHLLFMTATPIPRTLASAIFSDFASFRISEKPKVQKPRITEIVDPAKGLSQKYRDFIASSMRSKRSQALVIVPSISSEDMMNTKGAIKKYKHLFPDASIKEIHGDMEDEKVAKTIEEFMDGKFDMLVATTMVDAGFSNKKLSFVFIENPERFGIAQLHQIRGRVGRGSQQGYCFLCPSMPLFAMKEETRERILTVQKSEDGFFLSQKDIQLRGSGDLLGTAQSKSEINLLEWEKEIEMMKDFIKKERYAAI